MAAKWKQNNNLRQVNKDILLDRIKECATINEDKIQYSSIDYIHATTAIETIIDFNDKKRILNKKSIIQKAIFASLKNGNITPPTFMENINNQISEEAKKRDETFYILTSLSSVWFGLRSIQIKDATIRFYKNDFPRKFKGRTAAIKKAFKNEATESDGYIKVVIEIKGKSLENIIHRGLEYIDILRGIMCLLCNSFGEFIGSQWKPINKIRLGKFHTPHDSSGNIITGNIWLDPFYTYTRPYVSDNTSVMLKNIKYFISSLQKTNHEYYSILSDSLLKYVRAFDEQNHNVTTIRAWAALESIAAHKESNSDSISRRCAFLYEDYEYHKIIIECLREQRNKNVHSGEESREAKNNNFQIQYYFKELFFFHIQHLGKFNSIDEANAFLDMPTKKDELTAQLKKINKCMQFRNYTRT